MIKHDLPYFVNIKYIYMSQVRKYQEGGVTPEDKKKETVVEAQQPVTGPVKPVVPGLEEIILKETAKPETEATIQKPTSYIILDGEKFENNEENRQKAAKYFARVSDPNGGSQIFNQIKDLMFEASQNGYTINYDTPGNQFSYIDPQGQSHFIDWRHLNDRQDKRIQKERSWLGRFLDSAFNTKVQQSAEDVYKMRGLAAALRGDTNTETATAIDPNLISIGWGNNGFFNYLKDPETKVFLKDENGNLKYDKNSAENQKAMQILNRAKKYLGLTTDDERKQFQLDKAWNEDGRWDTLKGIYDSDPNAFNTNYDNIINKITTGQKLSDEDISWLKLFGFSPDGEPKTEEELAAKAANLAKTKWANAGYDSIYDKGKDWFDIGDDNLPTLNDVGQAMLSEYLMDSAGNEFNNDWLKYLRAHNADTAVYDWLNGYTLYNGRLYKTDSGKDPNSALGKIYATSGFIDKNKANQYSEAQKIINTFWGNPYEWTSPSSEYYSNFTWDQDANNGNGGYRTGRRYRSENGRYSGLKPDQQIVSYYDEDAERDYRGFVTDNGIRYAITNENGDVVLDGLTSEELKKYATIITDSQGNEIPYASETNLPFSQVLLYQSSDARVNDHTGIFYGDDNEYALYYNPKYQMPDRKNSKSWTLYTDHQLDAAYVVPTWIAYYLKKADNNGVTGMQKLLANPKMQEKFRNILKRLGDYSGNWTADITRAGSYKNIETLGKFLGMTESEIQATKDEWDDMMELEKVKRNTEFKVAKSSFPKKENIESHKQGGVIKKYAPGGGFAKVSGNSGKTKQNKIKIKDSRKSQELENPFDLSQLTSADKADLAGLAFDVASIATGSMPLAGGITGLIGTGTGLYADIKRDGFQWRDAGTAALSGTADIVSMIPGLGSGVQAAKVAAKIAKFSKPAIKLLAAAGAINAAAIVAKIAKGEKPTIQEWRILANGFASGINIAKLGSLGKPTKPGTFKDINIDSKTAVDNIIIKPKTGEDLPEIKLTKDQLRELDAITDPVKKQDKFKTFAKTSLAADPRTRSQNVNSLLNRYDLTKSTTPVPTSASGEITLNTRNAGEGPEITLSKAEIDEINAQPNAAAKMAKARETVAHKLWEKRGKPIGTPEVDERNALKYNYRDLWSPRVKSGLAGRPDITLDKTDIETISSKATPAEQQKAFVDIVKSKSGDDSLDSVDKIKDAFKVDDFFEMKRGSWEWRHPFASIKNLKKNETFTLKAERAEEPRPVRGNGKEGLFGLRDWWNNVGTYRGINRADLFNTKPATTPSAAPTPATPTSGTSGGTRTGANWWSGLNKITKPAPGILVMQPGNNSLFRIHNYTTEEAPGVVEDEDNNISGMTGAFTYKKGGLIPKADSGWKFLPQDWKQKFGESMLTALPTIGEFGSMIGAINANTKLGKTLKKGLENPPMMVAPQYNTPRFNDNGVLNEGRQLVKDIYNRQPANYTSDAMLNNFVKKANQEKATEYQNKINNAFSQQLATHNAKMQEIQNKNLENQINATNQNRQTIYANQNAKAQIDAATLISNWQSIDNFTKSRISELSQQLKRARALKSQFADDKIKADLVNNPAYKEASAEYKKYITANPSEIGFDEWIQTLGSEYKDGYLGAMGTARLNEGRAQIEAANLGNYGHSIENYLDTIWGTKIYSNKSGGKISKSSNYRGYRDYKEQIAIDSNKEIRKAIAQLNKNCQQLLLRMLK